MGDVSNPEPVASSQRLRRAAAAEHLRLSRERERLERRINALEEELASHTHAANEIRERLTVLAQVSDQPNLDEALAASDAAKDATNRNGNLRLVDRNRYLRGADIRIHAVRVLAARTNPSAPIHYTDWYELLQHQGYEIAGRDPLASFLTQIGRSPLVVRTSERGLYAIDTDVPTHLRERLRDLHQELAAIHDGQQTIDALETLADRRAKLTNEVLNTERALNEVNASLEHHAPNAKASSPAVYD